MRGIPARYEQGLSCLVVALVAMLAAPVSAEVPIAGEAAPGLEILDERFAGLVEQYGIPGAAVAIVKEGRLVYARGFGYANVEAEKVAQPTTLFRIASVSKPITATAVMRLVRQEKLSLDDHVVDLLELESSDDAEMDPRWQQITVRQLLQHTGGWNRSRSGDPMFQVAEVREALKIEGEVTASDIIRWMRGRPLDFDPGEASAYSNFGYCLLGRIVEKASGESYEAFVQREVFGVLGVERPRLGRTLPAEAVPGEARYYDPEPWTGSAVVGPNLGEQVPWPYGGWSLEVMDSHGGWIASAVDLARFLAAYQKPDDHSLVSQDEAVAMWAPPPGGVGHHADGRPRERVYGLGWVVRRASGGRIVRVQHGGTFSGTSSLIVLRRDGLAWVVLTNTRHTKVGHGELSALLDPMLQELLHQVETWPEEDLFPRYFP
jgi:dihydroorotase